jgi:hypothetical protein
MSLRQVRVWRNRKVGTAQQGLRTWPSRSKPVLFFLLRALSEIQRTAETGRGAPSKSDFTHHREKKLCRCSKSVSGAIVKWEPPNKVCVRDSHGTGEDFVLVQH